MHRLALVATVWRGLAACADVGPSPGRADTGRRSTVRLGVVRAPTVSG